MKRIVLFLFYTLLIGFQLKSQPYLFQKKVISKVQDTGKSKIQILIDKAGKGDTIFIQEGKYILNDALLIEKDLTLYGIGNVEIVSINPDDNVINLWGKNASLFNIKARHDSIVMKEMTCTGNVIWIEGGENIYIENCELNGCGVVGINGYWKHLTLKNNYIHHNSKCAIYDGEFEINDSVYAENITFIHNRIEFNGAPITENQIEENQGLLAEIMGFPVSEITTEIKKAWIYSERSDEVFLLLKQNDNYYKKAMLKQGIFTDVCYNLSANFYNDTIWLGCVNSNGYEVNSYLLYKNNELFHIGDTMFDVNQKTKEYAEIAYKNRKPVEYIQTLEGAQYYGQFLPNASLYALQLADTLCTEYTKQGNYLKAAQLMDSLEVYFSYTASSIVFDECSLIWIKAASYYLHSGMNEACIRLCKLLVNEKLESADLYLYYGDALFNVNMKTEASDMYKKYLKLTDNKNIPARVNRRCKI